MTFSNAVMIFPLTAINGVETREVQIEQQTFPKMQMHLVK